MSKSNDPFRLNVGFLINLPVGESREIDLSTSHFHVDEDIDLVNLSGSVNITRTSEGLLSRVMMKAILPAKCARCVENFQLPLSIDFTELFSFAHNSKSDSDLMLSEDYIMDLNPLVRDYMMLAVPINPVCSSNCKGLCLICGNNLNQSDCDHDIETIDPRLAVLQKLKENNDT